MKMLLRSNLARFCARRAAVASSLLRRVGAALAVAALPAFAQSFVPIYTIQGTGTASTYANQDVTTEGVVTGVFPGLGGSFIQDPVGDGNAATSDGIFLYGTTNYAVGTKIRFTATVSEFNSMTELSFASSISVTGTGITVAPTVVTLPASLERYEGMLVTFNQGLTVTENYNLNRYGELQLSANGRLIQPTNVVDPNDNPASGVSVSGTSNVAAVTALQADNNARAVFLDDGTTTQNPATNPYWDANYDCRLGSTVASLTGCLYADAGGYLVEPTQTVAINYAARPTGLDNLGAHNLKIAFSNVLNFFNGTGSGSGFPTTRGASTYAEFLRQRDKLVAACRMIDADVLGLSELENDGSGSLSAIADLTSALNAAYGSAVYDYIRDPAFIGTDEIKCGIIYKPAAVTPQGTALSDSSTVHNRPPVAQVFSHIATGSKFIFMVNHLKSKSPSGATGLDADQGDGQGAYNATRRAQAQAIVTYANNLKASTGVSDFIVLGDWNAYDQEDPVDVMRAAGYTALLEGSYSYVYFGQAGALDHIFVNSALAAKLTGAQDLHINADEPIHLDYNTEFNPAGAYKADAFRSSDHDPAIAAFALGGVTPGNVAPTASLTSPASGAAFASGSVVTLQASATDTDGTISKVDFYANGTLVGAATTAPYSASWTIGTGSYSLTAIATDNLGATGTSAAVSVTGTASGGAGVLIISEYVEGSSFNKVIELANVGGQSINLADYSLKKQTNGTGNWSSALTLSGTLAPGAVYVIAHSSASSSITANLRTSSTVMTFNGNDPVGLFKLGVLSDIVGTFNGGSANFAIDVTLRRQATVSTPSATYSTAQWDTFAKDTFSGLGTR